jgi:hypothetical protein
MDAWTVTDDGGTEVHDVPPAIGHAAEQAPGSTGLADRRGRRAVLLDQDEAAGEITPSRPSRS